MVGINLLQVINRWKMYRGKNLEGGEEFLRDLEIKVK